MTSVNKFGDSSSEVASSSGVSSSIGLTLSQLVNIFLRRDGANSMSADLDMNNHKVINVSDPTTASDATNKRFVERTTVSKTGDTMSGNLIFRITGNNQSLSIGCNNLLTNKRFNVLLGSTMNLLYWQIGQPITLQSSDGLSIRIGESDIAKFSTSNIILNRDLYMNQCKISNLRDPAGDNDAVNKKYADEVSASLENKLVSLASLSLPSITSTPTMTDNETVINGLTYKASASSTPHSALQPWKAFINVYDSTLDSGWVSDTNPTAWIQMQYPFGIVITSFNIFVRNLPGRNITLWSVQGSNDGLVFTSLHLRTETGVLASNKVNETLSANNYYSFRLHNTTAYTHYRFNIHERSGNYDIGIAMLQFNTNQVLSNGYTPMCANLNMGNNRITNLRNPTSRNEAVTKDYVDLYCNRLYLGSAEWSLRSGADEPALAPAGESTLARNDQFSVERAPSPVGFSIKLLLLTIYYKTGLDNFKHTKLIDISDGEMFEINMEAFKEVIELRTTQGSRYIIFKFNGFKALQPFTFSMVSQRSTAGAYDTAGITNIMITIYGLRH